LISNTVKSSFGNTVLRGTNLATFRADGNGTLLTQELQTNGLIAGLMARVFSIGSYKGSFRGELDEFARIAERETERPSTK